MKHVEKVVEIINLIKENKIEEGKRLAKAFIRLPNAPSLVITSCLNLS